MSRALASLFCLLLLAGPAWAFDPLTAARIDRRPNAQIPLDRVFVERTGQETTLGRLADGKPILLVPVQYNCPNICGVTLSGLFRAITAQKFRPGVDFTLVTIGIDAREKPQDVGHLFDRVAAAFPSFPEETMHGLTGTADDIAAVTAALGYRYAWDPDLRQFDHVAATAVLTPQGRLSTWLYGVAPEPLDLKLALTEAGAGRIGRWTDQLLLLCYHYDPATGSYTPIAWIALRIIAALVLLAILLLIGRAVLRERTARGRVP